MHKKTLSIGIGLLLLASPVLAHAEGSNPAEAALIASLQELIAVLTQELNSIIAARTHGGTAGWTTGASAIPTKTIHATGTAPQAVVDQALLTIAATPDPLRADMLVIPPFSGAAANTTGVAVVVIYGNYSGPTDFASASRFGQFTQVTPADSRPLLFMNVPVSGGRWQTERISFSSQPPSLVTVLVYNDPSSAMLGSAQPLSQTTVNISAAGSASATIDQALSTIPATPDPANPGYFAMAPFTGTATGLKYVTVVAINGSYTGSADFGTASSLGADTSTSGPSVVFPNLPVYNGRWRSGGITFAIQPPPLLSVLVYPSGASTTASASVPMARTSVAVTAASTTAASPVATAFVDQAALPIQATVDISQPGSIDLPPLTGSAFGESNLSIAVIPGQYSGALDYYAVTRIGQTGAVSSSNPLPLLFRNVPVLNGRWQTNPITLPQSTPPSQLTVLVYDYASAVKAVDPPIAESTVTILPTVKPSPIHSVYPSATIDQNLGILQLTNDPTRAGLFDTPRFTGSAKNTDNVTIAVIPTEYTGPTDFLSVSRLSQATGGATVPSFFLYRPVVNGRWQADSVAYSLPHPSALTILVYDSAAAAAGTGEPITSAVVGL